MAQDNSPRSPLFRDCHVLILEDDHRMLARFEAAISSIGCARVSGAADTALAFAIISTRKIDFAILDINLGDETCFGVAAHLKAGGIPFVFTRQSASEKVPPEFEGTAFIEKPFRLSVLEQTLLTAISMR